jgi:TonB family protein
MLVLSAAYPFLDFSQWFMHNATLTEAAVIYGHYLPELTVTAPGIPAAPAYSLGEYALGFYLAVTGILLLRLVFHLFKIGWLRIRCEKMETENKTVFRLQPPTPPCSFFHWIFIHPEMHKPWELHEILVHECVHARQHHSMDILLSEIVCAFCWINPLVWMLKGEIHRNLEFLVDYQVVREGVDSKSYQYHLLRLAYHPAQKTIVNQFNVSPLKERIMMLNAKQSPKMKLIAYTLLLPLVFLFVGANNAGAMVKRISGSGIVNAKTLEKIIFPEKIVFPDETGDYAQQKKTVITGAIMDESDKKPIPGVNIVIIGKTIGTISDVDGRFALQISEGDSILFSYVGYHSTQYVFSGTDKETPKPVSVSLKREVKNIEEVVVVGYGAMHNPPPATAKAPVQSSDTGEEHVFMLVEEMPEFPGGNTAMMNYIAGNIKYPVTAQTNGVHGRVTCSFVIDPSGAITDVKVVRSVDPSLDSEAVRLIYSMPQWKPGRQRGKAVAVRFTVPITFRLQGVTSDDNTASPANEDGSIPADTGNNNILALDMDSEQVINSITQKIDGKPLIYVDGELVTSLGSIDRSTIENISVFKNPLPDAADGLILIKTKNATEKEMEKIRDIYKKHKINSDFYSAKDE